jgi:hypothetical protein
MTNNRKSGPVDRRSGLEVTIVDGVLTITVGIETIRHAIQLHPSLEVYDEETGDFIAPEVTDIDKFAAQIKVELKSESEDGTTPVHRMLDQAAMSAIENGAEGIKTGEDILDERRRTRGRRRRAGS